MSLLERAEAVQRVYDRWMDAQLLDKPFDVDAELDKICGHGYVTAPDGVARCAFCGRVHP